MSHFTSYPSLEANSFTVTGTSSLQSVDATSITSTDITVNASTITTNNIGNRVIFSAATAGVGDCCIRGINQNFGSDTIILVNDCEGSWANSGSRNPSNSIALGIGSNRPNASDYLLGATGNPATTCLAFGNLHNRYITGGIGGIDTRNNPDSGFTGGAIIFARTSVSGAGLFGNGASGDEDRVYPFIICNGLDETIEMLYPLFITSDATIDGNFTANADVTVEGTLQANGLFSADGEVALNTDVAVNGVLVTNATTTANGTVILNTDVTINGVTNAHDLTATDVTSATITTGKATLSSYQFQNGSIETLANRTTNISLLNVQVVFPNYLVIEANATIDMTFPDASFINLIITPSPATGDRIVESIAIYNSGSSNITLVGGTGTTIRGISTIASGEIGKVSLYWTTASTIDILVN